MAPRFKSRDEFISGVTMTLVFAALWIFTGGKFWVFPMVFAGLVPAIRGSVRFFSAQRLPGKKRRELPKVDTDTIERAILSTARNEKGRVTPAIVALGANVSLEKAEKALEDMAKRGYTTMEVRDNGTVEYVFPEFLE